MDHSDCSAFLAAARTAADLASRPEVAALWTDESACADLSVGGLACHLVSQIDNAVRLLGAGASGQTPIPLADHYADVGWRNADDEQNVGIREGSDAQAETGPEALMLLIDRRLAELPEALGSVGSSEPVLIPWQGWSLTAHDFLVTRMMEIVVHSDDLAASVGLVTPTFPDEVLAPVLELLTGLSVRRHGATSVVRALTRPQRAPSTIAAF